MNGLGRLPSLDPRNKLFLFAAAQRIKPTRSKLWDVPFAVLDQGNTGTCVGQAGKNFLLSRPVIQTHPDVEPTGITLYKEACKLDEYSFNDDLNLQHGTSILGLMKAFAARGLVRGSYLWAYNALDVAHWVVHQSPVVIGVDWYADMMRPDGGNAVQARGGIVGGHAVLLIGYAADNDSFILLNSWGSQWGHNGRAFIGYATLDALLRVGGEAATLHERKLA